MEIILSNGILLNETDMFQRHPDGHGYYLRKERVAEIFSQTPPSIVRSYCPACGQEPDAEEFSVTWFRTDHLKIGCEIFESKDIKTIREWLDGETVAA